MITKYPNNSVSDFYKCTEEIATTLDTYFGREHGPVSDMSNINTFVEEYVHGWGITARSYGEEDLSRETQQEFAEVDEEVEEEPPSKAINSMFDLDDDGKVIWDDVVSVTLPDGSETTPGALEDVSQYTAKNLKIQSNGLGGLEPIRIRGHEGDKFQLQYGGHWIQKPGDKVYKSGILDSIDLEQVLVFMDEAMKVTEDYHHCFVENLCYKDTVDGVHILEIQAGS